MITKYYTRDGIAEIKTVQVIKETGSFVTIAVKSGWNGKTEKRESKTTTWDAYYDTWEKAHAALTEKADDKLAAARRALELAQSFAGNVKGLKPHQEPAPKGGE